MSLFKNERSPIHESMGADVVIDNTQEDIITCHRQFDVIFELSGRLSFTQANVIMKHDAVFLTFMDAGTIKDLVFRYMSSFFSKRRFRSLVAPPTKRIVQRLSEYATQGLQVHIGDSYSFQEITTVNAEIEKRGTIGKAVISLS
jgi:NADPH:quinone reductase-like Zn-dependent oxidoreductase